MGKKIGIILCAILLSMGLNAAEFSKVASGEPEIIQQGETKMWCPVCGMNLKMFYKTSHAVILNDNRKIQYCSIRCLAAEWPAIEGKVSKILVTDIKSEKLINAQKAFYVVGSKIPGTMSMVSKLAFEHEADAKAFAQENGGDVTSFDVAFLKARESLKDDVDSFVKKKQKGMYPMGEKIYSNACQKDALHVHEFNTISELKASLKKTKVCGELNEQELQAVGLYLWDILRFEEHHHHTTAIHVGEDEKCPVCGMFVYKYPRWAARLSYQEGDKKIDLAFDGVKDLLKFYHNPTKWGKYTKHADAEISILVTEYYTQEAMDGKKAFYVIGSDTYGPMGKEFIPFASLKSAETFLKDHKGTKILEFSKIEEALVYEQDK